MIEWLGKHSSTMVFIIKDKIIYPDFKSDFNRTQHGRQSETLNKEKLQWHIECKLSETEALQKQTKIYSKSILKL